MPKMSWFEFVDVLYWCLSGLCCCLSGSGVSLCFDLSLNVQFHFVVWREFFYVYSKNKYGSENPLLLCTIAFIFILCEKNTSKLMKTEYGPCRTRPIRSKGSNPTRSGRTL